MPTRNAEAEWKGNLVEKNCPVSKALAGTEIHLNATLGTPR
jgi:hypothetical protein